MNSMMKASVLRKCGLLLLVMVVPAFAWAQKKTSAPAPKPAAAPHAAAPAQHPAAQSRPSTPAGHNTAGTTGRPGTTNNSRPGTTNNGRPGTTNNSRPGTTNNGRPGTTNNNRPGATNTGKTNSPANRPGGASANGSRGNANVAHAKTTPAGMQQKSLKGGGTAAIRKDGSVRSINRNGMQIQHGLHGGRTVVSTHNGARVVTTGRHGGYVQRNYVSRNGHSYVSRTYVYHNTVYTGVYRSYGYGGYCCYYGYAPAYYYNPGYYGWAYNPWPEPAPYAWGWGAQPWYGYYGAYYQPYPVYPSAAFWLTDYLLAASLRAAFDAQAAAAAESGSLLNPSQDFLLVASMGPIPAVDSAVPLSPEVKNLLAEEVKAQLAADQADAGKSKSASGGQAASTDGPPPALDPKRKVFVVNDELSVVADGQECSLTSGDVISRVTDTPDDDKNVDVKVLASKKADCAVGAQVSVAVDDLQEMHNHFREQLTGGMDELSKKQGTGGLPKAPDTGKVDGEVPAPPPDSSAAKTLQEQQSAADKTEADVKQEASSSGGGSQ
jgi:hypothetical protein